MTRPWPALFLQRVWMAHGRMEASRHPVTAAVASGAGVLPVTSPTPPLHLRHSQPTVSDRSVCPASAVRRMTLWTSRTLAVCCLMSPFPANARSATISKCISISSHNSVRPAGLLSIIGTWSKGVEKGMKHDDYLPITACPTVFYHLVLQQCTSYQLIVALHVMECLWNTLIPFCQFLLRD